MAKRKVSERDLLIEQCLHDAYCEREGIINEGFIDNLKANARAAGEWLKQDAKDSFRLRKKGKVQDNRKNAAASGKIKSYAGSLAKTMSDFKKSGGTLGRNMTNIDDVINRLDLVSQGKLPRGVAGSNWNENDQPASNSSQTTQPTRTSSSQHNISNSGSTRNSTSSSTGNSYFTTGATAPTPSAVSPTPASSSKRNISRQTLGQNNAGNNRQVVAPSSSQTQNAQQSDSSSQLPPIPQSGQSPQLPPIPQNIESNTTTSEQGNSSQTVNPEKPNRPLTKRDIKRKKRQEKIFKRKEKEAEQAKIDRAKRIKKASKSAEAAQKKAEKEAEQAKINRAKSIKKAGKTAEAARKKAEKEAARATKNKDTETTNTPAQEPTQETNNQQEEPLTNNKASEASTSSTQTPNPSSNIENTATSDDVTNNEENSSTEIASPETSSPNSPGQSAMLNSIPNTEDNSGDNVSTDKKVKGTYFGDINNINQRTPWTTTMGGTESGDVYFNKYLPKKNNYLSDDSQDNQLALPTPKEPLGLPAPDEAPTNKPLALPAPEENPEETPTEIIPAVKEDPLRGVVPNHTYSKKRRKHNHERDENGNKIKVKPEKEARKARQAAASAKKSKQKMRQQHGTIYNQDEEIIKEHYNTRGQISMLNSII